MDKTLDIIILGATGFTGKRAVKNLALLNKEKEYADLTWGISGRSHDKILDLLKEMQEWGLDISKIPVMQCDIENEESLANVTRRAKVVVNATGPYAVLGEPVVKACVETGTHYVDIAAELHFMLNTYRKYHEPAVDANVLIVPSCGYACIPVVTGLKYLEEHFKGTLHSVECYSLLDIPKRAYFPVPWRDTCLLHYGTWQSLVYVLLHMKEYAALKKQTFPQPEPLPEENNKPFFHRHNGSIWFPYPGPDNDVVEMTQEYKRAQKGKNKYNFKIYTSMPTFFHFLIIVPAMFLYYYLCYFKCFSNLLWKYPRFFTLGYVSHKGPSKEMAKDMKFEFTFTGKGWSIGGDLNSTPNKTVSAKVSGCDPGYETAGVALIFAALTILKDSEKIPKGGFLTCGAAFSNTELLNRLIMNNSINYEILED